MENKRTFSQFQTILFVVIVCALCALVLSILAESLKTAQNNAKELYRSKQLLLAAQILGYDDSFLLNGVPAVYDPDKKILVPYEGERAPRASKEDILEVFESRIVGRLTNNQGDVYTFEQAGLNEEVYLLENAKLGYAQLPHKLVYFVKGNNPSLKPYAYVIPINGYGLWDAIYGYLGLKGNGNTVLAMTWYDQKETPGLGGEIGLPIWQKRWMGKEVFQQSPDGSTDFQTAPLGIEVVRTTADKTYGDRPFVNSAVDGIPGASITVSGVNDAIRNSLRPYRPFLLRAEKGEIQFDQ